MLKSKPTPDSEALEKIVDKSDNPRNDARRDWRIFHDHAKDQTRDTNTDPVCIHSLSVIFMLI